MSTTQEAGSTIRENPFYVLAVATTCTPLEGERAGQKWLSMLELGVGSAKRSVTPLGEEERTADRVRQAMAELRDPAQRVVCEAFATLSPEAVPGSEDLPPFAEALVVLGWRGR